MLLPADAQRVARQTWREEGTCHRRRVLVEPGETAAGRRRLFHEETDGIVSLYHRAQRPFSLPQRGQSQGVHPVVHLAGNAQGLAAGGQDVQSRAAAQKRRGQFRGGSDQVYAVVQDEQRRRGRK